MDREPKRGWQVAMLRPIWPDMIRLISILAVLLIAAPASAAPKSELWPRWQAHDPAATQAVDHTPWDRLLKAYLVIGEDGINRFAYGQVSNADRQALEDYVAALAATPVSSLARPEQMAYWINLYNALTVAVIVRHYPVASIRDIDISPGFFADGPWGKKLVNIEGEEVGLDDIEHRILRPIWKDPRIHYAVNCASIGCPNLAPAAFRPANLEAELTHAARAFINHPRGASVTDAGLVASTIYDWFQVDFGGDEAGVKMHLAQYATGDLAAALKRGIAIDGYAYDWALNGAE